MSETPATRAQHPSEPARTSRVPSSDGELLLRRPIGLVVNGPVICVVLAFLTGVLLRLVRLDAYVLNEHEGNWAYDAWSLYQGRPLPGTDQIPETSPLFLLMQSFMFFLFGVTDAIARLGPALFGVGILVLVLLLRPFVSRLTMVGMMVVASISPTLVFASRTIDPAIAVAFCTLLFVVALLRAGYASASGPQAGWMILAGFGAGGMIASGPEGITAFIASAGALVISSSLDNNRDGAVRAGIGAITRSAGNLGLFLASFIFTLILLFTRLFSDIGAITGILTTFADWGRMMASRSTPLTQSFFFYAILLYEILAVVFAIVAVSGKSEQRVEGRRLNVSLFVTWFLIALVFHSFASGREATQTVLVALPLVLLGGLGLGRVLERIAWSRLFTSRAGLFPLSVFGLMVGAVSIVMVIARANDVNVRDATGWSPWFQAMFVIVVVVVPMAYLIWSHLDGKLALRDLGNSVLLVLAILLVAFAFRSTTALAFTRAADGTELLARNVPTEGVRSLVAQVNRVSRDLSLENRSNVDNTGSYGLSIAVSPDVEWPFIWYFRDFPNVRVAGPAGWNDQDDVVIASGPEGMDTAGLVVQQRTFENRTANAHIDLDTATIVGNVFSPEEWYPSYRYLIFREMDSRQAPSTISVGYAFRVSNKINPNLGPFDLFTRNSPGPGSGLGQLSSPSGIAVSADGQVIYVVNAGNQRIERYTRDGSFIGVWDATSDMSLGMSFVNGQGASGIILGDDGLVYLADTWDHIVIVLDKEGRVVRQLGQRGVLTDIGDGGDPNDQPGLFFGPRGVAVLNDEIYVTDTGNERVQVFGKDGTFLRAFGGFGTGTGQLQEPTGIAIGPDGNVYVADSGNGRIVVFSPQGDVVREIPVESWAQQQGVDRINYLAFDANGILYLTAPSQGLLQAYDGREIVTITNVEITQPTGIAVAPDGMVLVTDRAEGEVVQFAPRFPDGFGMEVTPAASPAASPAN